MTRSAIVSVLALAGLACTSQVAKSAAPAATVHESHATNESHGIAAPDSSASTPNASSAPAAQDAQGAALAPRNLRVEYKTNPIGLDTSAPRFSWELGDDRRGAQQSAYRVLVSESPELLAQETGDMWDSKQVPLRDTNQIVFAGRELIPWRTYVWTVRTWDAAGKPSPWSTPGAFTMGPMRPSDWQASWISTEASSKVPKGGYVGYHSDWTAKEDDFKYVQIDFGDVAVFDSIVLHPARPKSGEKGALFPLRFTVYVDDSPNFYKTFMRAGEYTWQDIPNAGQEPITIPTPRFKIRYVRVVVQKMQKDGDKGYAFALGEFEVRDGTNNIAVGADASASDSIERDGWSVAALNDGQFVPGMRPPVDAKPAALLRKSFVLENAPKRAWLAASALGLYDVTINGRHVGDARLTPGWTDYTQRVPYQMYDVAPLLVQGENVIGVTLADGWYAGRIGLAGPTTESSPRGVYGSPPKFLAHLQIEPAKGPPKAVGTDSTWKWSPAGPVRRADLLDGQTTDYRDDQLGFDQPKFSAEGWRPVVESNVTAQMFAQVAEPIRSRAPIQAVSVSEPAPRVYVYDFGQNVSGVVRVNVDQKAQATMRVRHAEALDANGRIYTDNLRSALQSDQYTLRAGLQGGIEPLFTVHGFRYVEVVGPPTAPALADVLAVPLTTDAREVGSFECSDPLLTQLWKNIEWTRRNNFVGLPTDCPQRDERLGWMGDILGFAHTAMFQADLASVFTQWLAEVRGAQVADGRMPDFAPHPFSPADRMSGTPGWGDAGVFVPWEMYVHYHDQRVLAASVDSMVRWVDYVQKKNPSLVWKDARGGDYGDWLDGDSLKIPGWTASGNGIPKDVFATAFFARSCEIAAKAAFATSKPKEAQRMAALAKEVRAAFRHAFVDESGRIQGDSQAGYALAIDFGLFEEDQAGEARAVDHLVRKIGESKGALTTGFHATHRALLALSRHGHHDLALKIALRREAPSWGYAIDNGATTIWERWDGWLKNRGFQDKSMNSLDHFAFGSIGEWMVRTIGGIELVDNYPSSGPIELTPILDGPTKTSAEGPRAFEHVVLRPMIAGLEWAKCDHASIAGKLSVSWKVAGDVLTYDCTIPPNTSATLELPAADRSSVTEGDKPVDTVKGLHVWGHEKGRASIEVPAGTYHFASKLK